MKDYILLIQGRTTSNEQDSGSDQTSSIRVEYVESTWLKDVFPQMTSTTIPLQEEDFELERTFRHLKQLVQNGASEFSEACANICRDQTRLDMFPIDIAFRK